ncbi:MAG: hypothetical protein MUC77_04570 [Chromatiaceae bacterium]|nr:hypothetical protein [Chromatiaceae bacterium]
MNSRRKGADGERELARALREALGIEVSRNLQQTRDGGHDMEVGGYGVEVKRSQRVTEAKVTAWWQQAVRQAAQAGLTPALAYRQDRQPWSVRVPMAALRQDLPGELTVDLSLEGFIALLHATEATPQVQPASQRICRKRASAVA